MRGLIVLELWRVKGVIHGREREDFQPTVLAKQYGTTYDLPGKAAHYFCVTDDSSISRADCVGFCHDHFRGSVRTINVDLSKVFFRRDHPNKLWEEG